MNGYKITKKTTIQPYVWNAYGISLPFPEYQFDQIRKWKIDYAWPSLRLAVEIEGGIWTCGRHVQPQGFINDMIKYNRMAIEKWFLLRYEPNKIDYLQIKKMHDSLMP